MRERLADTNGWNDSKAYQALFGDTANARYITFFDALYVLGSGCKGQALWPDVITVHHKEYYGNDGMPPADWDRSTGRYTIASVAPPKCEAWIALALEILGHALRELGISAKTSSGYGRMVVEDAPIDRDKEGVDEFVKRINALSIKQVASECNKYVQEWRSLEVAQPLRRRVAEAILAKNREAGWEKTAQDKSWSGGRGTSPP